MTHSVIDKPWDHPERSDWCKGLNFMVNQIKAGTSREKVIKDTVAYIEETGLKVATDNISRYYPWLHREIKSQNSQDPQDQQSQAE